MIANPVIIFGAGATKACGGPLTNEILPEAFHVWREAERHGDHQTAVKFDREGFLRLLDAFLVENFHVPSVPAERKRDDYPALPLLLSLIDTAVDRKQSFGPKWVPDELVRVRDALEYAIFVILEHKLQHVANYYDRLLGAVFGRTNQPPAVLSLNYDIIADNALARMSEWHGPSRFPSYECDIATDAYRNQGKFGKLLKLHGSLNWLYCPGCHRLDLGISESGKGTIKVLEQLYQENRLEDRYACHGSPCPDPNCQTHVRPVMITPTHRKDYRNPHVAQVWYQAERLLRGADRVIVVGYSLPEDDVEVIYLFKRGLARLPANRITVVEYDSQQRGLLNHPVGARYRSVFGSDLDWHTEGFEKWLVAFEQQNSNSL